MQERLFFGLKHLCSAVFPSACKKYQAKSSPCVNNWQKIYRKYEKGISQTKCQNIFGSKGDGMEEGWGAGGGEYEAIRWINMTLIDVNKNPKLRMIL